MAHRHLTAFDIFERLEKELKSLAIRHSKIARDLYQGTCPDCVKNVTDFLEEYSTSVPNEAHNRLLYAVSVYRNGNVEMFYSLNNRRAYAIRIYVLFQDLDMVAGARGLEQQWEKFEKFYGVRCPPKDVFLEQVELLRLEKLVSFNLSDRTHFLEVNPPVRTSVTTDIPLTRIRPAKKQ